jgi:hypothetical protein
MKIEKEKEKTHVQRTLDLDWIMLKKKPRKSVRKRATHRTSIFSTSASKTRCILQTPSNQENRRKEHQKMK